MEKQNIDQINGMMALSEEINVLNQKVKQMVEHLHGTSEGIAVLKDLSTTMVEKMNKLKTGVNGYTPEEIPQAIGATPSNEDGINERERIVPTPENYMDYIDAEPVTLQKKVEDEAPSLKELTTPKKPVVKSSIELDEEKAKKVETLRNKTNTKNTRKTNIPAKSKRLNRKKASPNEGRPPARKKAPKRPAKKKGFFGR